MNKRGSYNTKQREAILRYIISLNGAHITAPQLAAHFAKEPDAVGRTTVYRHLVSLTNDGWIRKYTTDGVSGSCYQYVPKREDCKAHLHLKCDTCGELQHLDCSVIERLGEIEKHLLTKHSFLVNRLKTVLYGSCESCRNKEGESI